MHTLHYEVCAFFDVIFVIANSDYSSSLFIRRILELLMGTTNAPTLCIADPRIAGRKPNAETAIRTKLITIDKTRF